MKFSVPVYVETSEGSYHLRPLFFPDVTADSEVLGRATARLAMRLRNHLESLGAEARHDALAACTFQPDLHHHQVHVAVETARGTARSRLLVVTLEALGRRLALIPALPALMFDVERGERLEDRVVEMATRYIRDRERDEDSVELPSGRAWITEIDVHCTPPREHEMKEPASLLALLGGSGEAPDGAQELQRVGRRLDDLHPDDLERSILRETEVAQLLRALDQADRRPVLVHGPRRVGKTALVHEAVFRRVEARMEARTHGVRGSTWLLAPQRLISGMQMVGQWEARLVAILEIAKKHDYVLYFDDLPGLFTAGPSASSDLSVADVLKPFVERRDVRIVGEITPAGLRVLQERDRGLADMFEIVPLKEPVMADTLRVVMDGVRRAEVRQKTRFTPEAIGLVVDLQRRLVRDAAFPGKACVFAAHLAARHRDGRVTREAVLDEFHASSGLRLEFLDDQRRMPRDDVLAALRRHIIGQDEAVQAMADAVGIAKARIAASTRPLASLLFLGPTGVGKTRCARALATYLFGDESRLVRFDMNEFISPDSVARLVGTFASPSGLLTSAVRQSPFCVLLLDEIEKAHPDVFNLLLQVLGDGRLTDAHGRTVDFTQAIVIMTSNLGVQETSHPLGFRTEGTQEGLVYRRAAEQFFAPEFFNRIDRVVGFERLSREDVGRIARQLMGSVLAREGLVRRQCILQVDSRAFEAIVEEGFHPVLGARALKRAVERHVAGPLAGCLAGIPPRGAMLLALFGGRDGVTAAVHPFRQARAVPSPLPAPGEPLAPLLQDIASRLDSLEKVAESLAPEGPLDSQQIGAVHMQYFRLREGLERARRHLGRLRGHRSPPRQPRRPRPGAPERRWLSLAPPEAFADILSEVDLRSALRRATDAAGPTEPAKGQRDPRAEAVALARETALLATVAAADAEEEALVWIRGLDDGDPRFLDLVAMNLVHACTEGLDLDADFVEPPASLPQRALRVRGTAAWRLLHGEQGTHLFLQEQPPQPVAVVVQRVAEGTASASLDALRAGRAQWIEAMRRGQATFFDAPHPLGDVIRLYDAERALDLRSGAVVEGLLDGAATRELILGGLS